MGKQVLPNQMGTWTVMNWVSVRELPANTQDMRWLAIIDHDGGEPLPWPVEAYGRSAGKAVSAADRALEFRKRSADQVELLRAAVRRTRQWIEDADGKFLDQGGCCAFCAIPGYRTKVDKLVRQLSHLRTLYVRSGSLDRVRWLDGLEGPDILQRNGCGVYGTGIFLAPK